MIDWLVVSTPLQNISQLFTLFPIYGKNVPTHQPVTVWLHIDRLVFRLGGNPTEARFKKKSKETTRDSISQ